VETVHLKSLIFKGFKSFADRTELRFSGGGIAAVVGPNDGQTTFEVAGLVGSTIDGV
jgi:hypothetical protein